MKPEQEQTCDNFVEVFSCFPRNDALELLKRLLREALSEQSAHIQSLEEALRDGKRLVRDVLSEFYSHRYVVAGAMPTDGSCDTRWMRDAEKWIEASAALSPAPATTETEC